MGAVPAPPVAVAVEGAADDVAVGVDRGVEVVAAGGAAVVGGVVVLGAVVVRGDELVGAGGDDCVGRDVVGVVGAAVVEGADGRAEDVAAVPGAEICPGRAVRHQEASWTPGSADAEVGTSRTRPARPQAAVTDVASAVSRNNRRSLTFRG
ncbi:hypothetical protein [Geodermatophilus sp. TF02-6]|uniref:hypothetical protein n=1 Tax=Geodermatophilus sp. TF02-6 TaxID=2250575 RepID=UPI0011BEC846|nr:hypothetical protein [Geodermatophilus sp. TF02-6]